MDSAFGDRLRAHRERRQVSLAAIADQTKIKLSLLEGLERDDVSYWPRGIFRRSYIRAYAQAIGLDPEATAREFLARYPDPDEDVQSALLVAHGLSESAEGAPPIRLRFLVNSAIDALSGLRQQAHQAVDARGRGQADSPAMRLEFDLQQAPAGQEEGAADAPVAEPDGPGEVSIADEVFGADPPERELQADADELLEPAEAADDAPWHEEVARSERRLAVLARLCTRLGCAQDLCDVQPVLGDAAQAVDAASVTLWLADAGGRVLAPVFAWGYPEDACARLPRVPRDSDNALARAFRSAGVCTVDGSDTDTGAVVVPVMTSGGCAGALAFELRDGGEREPFVSAFASILAAQLATLVKAAPMAATRSA